MISTINASGEASSLLSVKSTPVAGPSGGTDELAVDQFENFFDASNSGKLKHFYDFFSIDVYVYAW